MHDSPKIVRDINKFYAFFTARQVGGIEAIDFPKSLRDLVIQKFGGPTYVNRLTINLAEVVALILKLYSLRREIDLEKLKDTGIQKDIIRHLKTIDRLWARMDKALLMLARQKYEYDWQGVSSVDGMNILEKAIFAIPLHDFLDNLDLFQDDKFMAKIQDWREGMESILINILMSLGRKKEADELFKVSLNITVQLGLRMPDL